MKNRRERKRERENSLVCAFSDNGIFANLHSYNFSTAKQLFEVCCVATAHSRHNHRYRFTLYIYFFPLKSNEINWIVRCNCYYTSRVQISQQRIFYRQCSPRENPYSK